MAAPTYYTEIVAGNVKRYQSGPSPIPTGTVLTVVPNATLSDWLAATETCPGTGSAPPPAPNAGINGFSLKYDEVGLTALANASVATEAKLSRPDGMAVDNAAWNPMVLYPGEPALPAAGTYAYTFGTLLPGITYEVTLRKVGATDPATYLKQQYTVPGTPPPPQTGTGINFVSARYDADGLVGLINASILTDSRIERVDGKPFPQDGLRTSFAPTERFDGDAPPATGSDRRIYGRLPDGDYRVIFRPKDENNQSTYRSVVLRVKNPTFGLNSVALQYDANGLTATLNASVATEVRLSSPGGVVGNWIATARFDGPALPGAGSYRHIYGLLSPGTYLVTFRPAGSADATTYQTATYTVTGGPAPPPQTPSAINEVYPSYSTVNGFTVDVNASSANQVALSRVDGGSYGNSAFLNTTLYAGEPAPPAAGTYSRFYGLLPAGDYAISARPVGVTDVTKYRTKYFSVAATGPVNLNTGYRWDGSPANYSFLAVAAVSDGGSYEFYLEPLDGQSPPIGGFQFLALSTTSKTVAGVAVNREGFHGPRFQGFAGVFPGRWKLHVQKTGQPETRDTRFVTLNGGAGEESDMGDGVASTKPIWNPSFNLPAMTPGTEYAELIPFNAAYNPDNTAVAITPGSIPNWLSFTTNSLNQTYRIGGQVPSFLTSPVDIQLIASGKGGSTPKTFRPAVNGAAPPSAITQIGYSWARNNPASGQPSVARLFVQHTGAQVEFAILTIQNGQPVGGKSSYSPLNANASVNPYTLQTNVVGASPTSTQTIYMRAVGTTTDLLTISLPTYPTSATTVPLTVIYSGSGGPVPPSDNADDVSGETNVEIFDA